VGATAEEDLRGIQLRHLAINCTGTKIAILADLSSDDSAVRAPDARIHVYDVELDKVFSFQFGPHFYPIRADWDRAEAKLIAVETKKFEVQTKEKDDKQQQQKDGNGKGAGKDVPERKEEEEGDEPADKNAAGSASSGGSAVGAEVTTLFATSDYGVLMQDSFAISPSSEGLLALDVPHILFMARPSDGDYDEGSERSGGAVMPHVKRRTMRDFVGLESGLTEDTKRDLLSFSYFLTVGLMDEAYRAVKKISSATIWQNMATMAVKTKRLDVAEVCLGNMGDARGAKAVREARASHPVDKEVAVAMLAIQLGMLDDAERLYKECGRYDLLVQLYMASGRWKDALKAASKHDRIHLKSTHYQYARHLEHMGDTAAAITHYEQSHTHKHEVPRMLFDSQHIGELEQYIKASDDPQLIKWWAQYCESNGAYDDAVRYYDQAGETLALVRVYCYRGEDEKAAKVCVERQDLAACYHLARQYEQQQRIGDAIHFYKLARRYNHGVRLAKEHFLDGELMQLALECSSAQLKVDAAKFFEDKQDFDKAVLLYQKGGKVARALDLCFKGQLFDSLRTISDALGPETDPSLLSKCGDFFFQHGQFEKSVHLFIMAKQVLKALTICMKHGVKVTEQMAERMTPAKTKDEQERVRDKHTTPACTRVVSSSAVAKACMRCF
jgi:intraflagellar transport protein 140